MIEFSLLQNFPKLLIFSLLLGVVLSILLTPQVIKFAHKWGVVDQPNERKVHQFAMPRMGGLAVFVSFFITLACIFPWLPEGDNQALYGLLIGGVFIFALGLYDDFKEISAKYKFLAQILVALFIASQGVLVQEIDLPLFSSPLSLDWYISWPLTIIWIVGVCNAINLMDGLDGLAAGISLIVLVTISAVALLSQNYLVAWISIPLIGSLLGFLKYNFNPAKIFMGDCGSLFLGYMLASLSLLNSSLETSTVSLIMPVVALGLPIFDTVFSMIRRVLVGKKMFQPDKEHVHHQILRKGFSHKQTVIILYLIASAFCILSFAFIAMKNKGLAALILLYPLMFYWLVRRLGYLGKIATIRNRWLRRLTRNVYAKDYKLDTSATRFFRYLTSNSKFLMILDLVSWSLTWSVALWFVHPTFVWNSSAIANLSHSFGLYLIFNVITFKLWLCYIFVWRFLEFNSIGRFYKSSSISILSSYLLMPFVAPNNLLTNRFFILLWILNIVAITLIRVGHNYYFNFVKREASHLKEGEKVLIYGCGDNAKLIQTLFTRMDNLQYNLIGFIDDDPLKQGKCIYRYPVVGTTLELAGIIKEHEITDLVFSTIPTIKNMELLEELDRKHEIKLTVFSVELHEVHNMDSLRSTIQQKLGV